MGEQLPAFSAQGIHCIDTGLVRPGFDAAWLVVEQGRAAFIDCGLLREVMATILSACAAAAWCPRTDR